MARMIDALDVLTDWDNSERTDETYDEGYNFAVQAIKQRGEWVIGALITIVMMHKDNGSFNDFDAGVRDAVDAFERGELYENR